MSAVVPPGATSGIRSRGTLRAQKEPAENSTGWIAAHGCGRGSVARGGRGFTLIEFIITVAIMGIIAALAAPSFNRMMKEYRLNSTADQLYTEILRARSEAIKRGNMVVMCRSANAQNLEPTCGGTADLAWGKGWLVYAYADNTRSPYAESNYDNDKKDVLLSGIQASYDDYDVTITSNSIGNPWLAFNGDGTLAEANIAYYAICDDRDVTYGRLITVYLYGGVTIKDLPADGVNSCEPPG